MNFKILKEKIFNLKNLTVEEAGFIFDLIMTGKISEILPVIIKLKIKLVSSTVRFLKLNIFSFINLKFIINFFKKIF